MGKKYSEFGEEKFLKLKQVPSSTYFGKKKLGLGKESFSNSNRFHLAYYGKQYCPNKVANFLQLFISLCMFGAAKLNWGRGREREGKFLHQKFQAWGFIILMV